ncbi:ER membrane protein DP1/Yop1 [Cladochytrium tenue]|nr:ER membrane protein DP1/Yop1 [Cladochytrium tenue]
MPLHVNGNTSIFEDIVALSSRISRALVTNLDAGLATIPFVRNLEITTGFGRMRLFYFGVAILVGAGLVASKVNPQQLTHFAAYIYPTVQSLRAAESGIIEDCRQWLAFWVIYSFMTFVEYAEQPVLAMLPHYYLLKLIFIGWLILPRFNGALIMYHSTLKTLPLLPLLAPTAYAMAAVAPHPLPAAAPPPPPVPAPIPATNSLFSRLNTSLRRRPITRRYNTLF